MLEAPEQRGPWFPNRLASSTHDRVAPVASEAEAVSGALAT